MIVPADIILMQPFLNKKELKNPFFILLNEALFQEKLLAVGI